jgi:type VI secretion system protein ImpF
MTVVLNLDNAIPLGSPMSANSSTNRFHSHLLGRLTDHHPGEPDEGAWQGTLTLQEYRRCVLQDLTTLLNTRSPAADSPVHDFAAVARSVLNYGLRDLCGSTVSQIDRGDLERQIRRAVQCFEPRIEPQTLVVRAIPPDPGTCQPHTLLFEVEGQLWACPASERHLRATAELDLETGRHTIKECTDEHQ